MPISSAELERPDSERQDSHSRDPTPGPSQPRPQNAHWDTITRAAESAPKEPEVHARTYFEPTLFPGLDASNTLIPNPTHPSGRAEPLSSRGSELIMQMEELGRAVQYSSPDFFLANHGATLALQEKMERFLMFCVMDDADVRGDEWFVRLSRLVARQRRVLRLISSRVSGTDRVNGNGHGHSIGFQSQPQHQRAVPGGFAYGGNAAAAGRSNEPVRGTFEQASGQRPAISLPARRTVAGTSGGIGTARYPIGLYRRQGPTTE
ncbi:uncharacterized protein BDV14DRAFT_206184 [Aspergillus stella-maris]|uniref:uncharacterized protein n=1 Tax=Aspergillus stella-maris TaxID=1810926 RepID=UPI003CCD215B